MPLLSRCQLLDNMTSKTTIAAVIGDEEKPEAHNSLADRLAFASSAQVRSRSPGRDHRLAHTAEKMGSLPEAAGRFGRLASFSLDETEKQMQLYAIDPEPATLRER